MHRSRQRIDMPGALPESLPRFRPFCPWPETVPDPIVQRPAKLCAFCRRRWKLTDEHVLPFWLDSGDSSDRAQYMRQRGGPDQEPWFRSRRGKPRDLQAKAVCADCNGWMNKMDHSMSLLGPRLVRGKATKLTRGKQETLAAWSVKLILMLNLVYPRESRFMIADADYPQFYADRQPSDLMMLWTGYMEPPGKNGGHVVSFAEHRHDEARYGETVLTTLGLAPSLASDGYHAKFRLGHCVAGMLRAGCADVLPYAVLRVPRQWVQIWPPRGTREWPPQPMPSRVGLAPMEAGFRTRPRRDSA